MNSISRRLLLAGGAAGGLCGATTRRDRGESIYLLTTNEWDIRITVEFHDCQRSKNFAFLDRSSGRRFCLSGQGEEDVDGLRDFVGSIAVARYHLRPRKPQGTGVAVQEKVRTIDADSRLPDRPPFERRMEVEQGVISDIQAFGYQASNGGTDETLNALKGPWSLLRQDLFMDGHT
jgi:hypothetical protein